MEKAKVVIDIDYQIGKVERRIFSAFLEPIGNWVYGGIYNPKHPTADEDGFRGDILEEIRRFNLPAIRLPGGNWVSGWEWENSIGPINERKTQLDLAWFQIEPNVIGLDEYLRWCEKANVEPMFTINLGTEDIKDAMHLVEYCRHRDGTFWSELRKKNGHSEPYPIKIWYLGNEMDGHWQIGSWEKNPEGYGIIAHEVSKIIKWIDNKAETVMSGVSDYSKNFPQWFFRALEQCYEMVDYVSVHYYHLAPEGDIKNYLNASSVFEEHLKTIISICDYIQAKIGTPKKVYISVDEYGVMFGKQQEVTFGRRGWKDASKVFMQFRPREKIFIKNDPENFVHFRRPSYQILEALGNASILLSLIRHADRVKIACMTGGLGRAIAFDASHVWKNALYYPYYQLNKLASNGISILPVIDGPTFNTVQFALNDFQQCHSYENVQSIEVAAVYHEDNSEMDIFIINRDDERNIEVALDIRGVNEIEIIQCTEMYASDINLSNSFEKPDTIIPQENKNVIKQGTKLNIQTNKLSWNTVRLKICK